MRASQTKHEKSLDESMTMMISIEVCFCAFYAETLKKGYAHDHRPHLEKLSFVQGGADAEHGC